MKPVTAQTLTPSSYGVWVPIDITSYVGGDAGSVGAAMLFVANTGASREAVDVRAVGSSYTTNAQMQLEAGAAQFLVAPTDPSDAFEINCAADVTVQLVGYQLAADITFLGTITDVTPATTGAYTAVDLSASVPAGTQAVLLRARANPGGQFGTRPTGDTTITAAGYVSTNNFAEIIVPITSQACEVYVDSGVSLDLVAYWTGGISYLSMPQAISAAGSTWANYTVSPASGYDVALVQWIYGPAGGTSGIRGGDEAASLVNGYSSVLAMPAGINASNEIGLYGSGGSYYVMGWAQSVPADALSVDGIAQAQAMESPALSVGAVTLALADIAQEHGLGSVGYLQPRISSVNAGAAFQPGDVITITGEMLANVIHVYMDNAAGDGADEVEQSISGTPSDASLDITVVLFDATTRQGPPYGTITIRIVDDQGNEDSIEATLATAADATAVAVANYPPPAGQDSAWDDASPSVANGDQGVISDPDGIIQAVYPDGTYEATAPGTFYAQIWDASAHTWSNEAPVTVTETLLTLFSLAQGHALDAPALIPGAVTLSVDDMAQTQGVDSPMSLSLAEQLAVDVIRQNQALSGLLALTGQSILIAQDLANSQALTGSITVAPDIALSAAGLAHAQVLLGAVGLAQAHILAVTDIGQEHELAGAISLIGDAGLVIADLAQGQVLDVAALPAMQYVTDRLLIVRDHDRLMIVEG